jgi:ribosomal protein L7/L12
MTGLTLLIILSVALVLLCAWAFFSRQQVRRGQEQGLWPRPGQTATDQDVERLAKSGNKILAIKLYRQIHRVGLKEAKDAVEKLGA